MMYGFDRCVKLGMMAWLGFNINSFHTHGYYVHIHVFILLVCVCAQNKSSVHLMAHIPHASARVLSPEAGRPDAALHPGGEHIQPLVCAVGLGRGHTLQRPGETRSHLLQEAVSVWTHL